jgi:formylglycine-generating enzyme required for sulfatase activity
LAGGACAPRTPRAGEFSEQEIKDLFAHSPLMGEWAAFRRARPEAVRAVREADEHFLAGRKDQGVAALLGLLKQRGVGEATVAHHLGLVELSRGDPAKARQHLRQATQAGPTPALSRTLASLSTLSGRKASTWRSLPRGFVLARKYRIEAEVGRGGMASVYRAESLADFEDEDRTVAIKVPSPALMADPGTRQRFMREIQVSRRLTRNGHEHIVGVRGYEVFDDPFTRQELYALVMQYIEGVSLEKFLARRRAAIDPAKPGETPLLKLGEVLSVMEGMCSALEHAHAQGVFHRDLKPHNVMVAKGTVKLMDFGIARVLDDGGEGLTSSGQVVGTLAYLPPELLGGSGVVDARTDVYMAGTLLLELLTGDPTGDPRTRQDCPPEWIKLIEDSTSRSRGARPENAAAFRARLNPRKAAAGPSAAAAVPAAPVARIVEARQALPREFTNSIGMKFVLIPAGAFRMGSPGRGSDEAPVHEVEITKPFYLSVTPVTQEQYAKAMGDNPSYFWEGCPGRSVLGRMRRLFLDISGRIVTQEQSSGGGGKDEVRGLDTRSFPVEGVSWEDAQTFLERLAARKEEKKKGRKYRLPSEAEWEYSCRGGVPSQVFHFGNSLSSRQANFDGNYPYEADKDPYLGRTCEVGRYPANAFGLFDMHGNVWEWCEDWYADDYYRHSPRRDPPGPSKGVCRVIRGGSWDRFATDCRSAYRGKYAPANRNRRFGFRVALAPSGE